MTDETFERASEIRAELDRLYILQGTLENSCGRYLAAVDGGEIGYTLTITKCVNHALLSKSMCDKLNSVIWEEIHTLQDEFKNL